MTKKSFIQRMAGGVITFAMLTSVCAASVSAIEAAGAIDLLEEGTFEDDDPTPWHVYGAGEADATMEIVDGVCKVGIIENGGKDVGGTSRWDLQLVCGGINLQSGHTYLVRGEVTPDADGEIYTKIGNVEGNNELWRNGYGKFNPDYAAGDKCIPCIADKKLVFECTWLCPQDMENAEWAFQFGGAGDYQENDCFPNGTTLLFDNLSISDVSLDASRKGKGDVNLDSVVSIGDVVLLQRYLNEEELSLQTEAMFQADVYADDLIDSNDATTLLRYVAHIEHRLPVQPTK